MRMRQGQEIGVSKKRNKWAWLGSGDELLAKKGEKLKEKEKKGEKEKKEI